MFGKGCRAGLRGFRLELAGETWWLWWKPICCFRFPFIGICRMTFISPKFDFLVENISPEIFKYILMWLCWNVPMICYFHFSYPLNMRVWWKSPSKYGVAHTREAQGAGIYWQNIFEKAGARARHGTSLIADLQTRHGMKHGWMCVACIIRFPNRDANQMCLGSWSTIKII